jgi:uncharacterized protein (UPF0261 family)
MAKAIAIVGTLDTKGEEIRYIKERVESRGYKALVIDGGILGKPLFPPDISREQVAQAAGTSLNEVIALGDENQGIAVMGRGAAKIAQELCSAGKLHGMIALGGTMGTWLGLGVMRTLPLSMPKLMLSTVAFTHFVTAEMVGKGQMMAECVAGLWGLNVISKAVLDTAVGAIAGMIETAAEIISEKPIIGITTMGSAAFSYVPQIKPRLEERGYEVAVFHTSGLGGLTLERLIDEGLIAAALDLCLFDLGCQVTGSLYSVGPNRLEAAAKKGIPFIAAPGGTDHTAWPVPPEGMPARFRNRTLRGHNPNSTGVMLSQKEKAEIGRLMAQKLNRATGPVAVVLPLRGVSQFDEPGGMFYDPEGREALVQSLKQHIAPKVEVVEIDANINDPAFSDAVIALFDKMM